MIDQSWRRARRILAVRLDNLGDVLLTTPAIRAVKAALPEATIHLLTSPVGAQAGRLNPDIADVIVHEAPWVDPWQQLPHCPGRERALIGRLQDERFDAAIIFTSFRQSSLPAAYLCYLAGIPLRLGASVDGPAPCSPPATGIRIRRCTRSSGDSIWSSRSASRQRTAAWCWRFRTMRGSVFGAADGSGLMRTDETGSRRSSLFTPGAVCRRGDIRQSSTWK